MLTFATPSNYISLPFLCGASLKNSVTLMEKHDFCNVKFTFAASKSSNFISLFLKTAVP